MDGKKYYKVSNQYAEPIMETVRIFKDKNDLQREFNKYEILLDA